MATRVNTKFIIALVAVILLLVTGGVFAFKYAKRSAADRASNGDEAYQTALVSYGEGDTEIGNEFAKKAWREYGAAMVKDRNNTTYIYQFIDAHELYICEDMTEAENQLVDIISASRQAHEVDGATAEDELQYYDRLVMRFRQGLVIDRISPLQWIALINRIANEDYNASDSNTLARRWRGVSGVYLLKNDETLEQRVEPLDDLNAALEADPADAEVIRHIARWHWVEARRLYAAAGKEITPTVADEYAQAEAYLLDALAAAPDDLINRYYVIEGMFNLLATDARWETRSSQILPLVRQLIDSKEDRERLTGSELMRVIAWLGSQATWQAQQERVAASESVASPEGSDAPATHPHHFAHQRFGLSTVNLRVRAGLIAETFDGRFGEVQ